jgi:hypothetical protein
MSIPKHTSGPWIVGGMAKADGAFDYAIMAEGQIIAEVFGRTSEENFQPSDANALLIAAAPEMLEALEKLVNGWMTGSEVITTEMVKYFQQTIAKARGES